MVDDVVLLALHVRWVGHVVELGHFSYGFGHHVLLVRDIRSSLSLFDGYHGVSVLGGSEVWDRAVAIGCASDGLEH